MLFDRKRYFWLAVILVLLTLAYVLMGRIDNRNPLEFNDSIFSFRRLTVAPLIILGTYSGLIVLILKKPKSKCSDEKQK